MTPYAAGSHRSRPVGDTRSPRWRCPVVGRSGTERGFRDVPVTPDAVGARPLRDRRDATLRPRHGPLWPAPDGYADSLVRTTVAPSITRTSRTEATDERLPRHRSHRRE